RRSRLVCPPLPAPWHLLVGLFEWDALTWTDRMAALRMAAPLRLGLRHARGHRRSLAAASPGETVESWLVRHGQTEALREMLWRSPAPSGLDKPAGPAAGPR